MRHFDITQWSDHLRGVGSEERHAVMRSHLEDGCESCERVVASLRRIVEDAAQQQSPPDWAVRSVRAFFSLQQPSPGPAFSRLAARLAFDSALAPVAMGTRGPATESRQLVYYAQEIAVSLQLDYVERERKMNLGGEILHRRDGALEKVPTVLLSGNEVVGRATTGEFGEFFLTTDADSPFRLWLVVGEDRVIEVELERPAGAALEN